MNTLDDVISAVAAEGTIEDSAAALLVSDTGLIGTLKQQLADALSGATLPPAVQAKVDEVFATAQANAQKLADAVKANTPAV